MKNYIKIKESDSKRGGENMKKVITLLLATIILVMSVVTCFAEDSVKITFEDGGFKEAKWQSYGAQCTLTKPGKKDASVKVTFSSAYVSQYGYYAVDIAMKDENGRTIWAEDDSIVAKKSWNTDRVYKLGRDHSVYRLYFRPSTAKLNGGAYVIVSKPKNCTLTLCHW